MSMCRVFSCVGGRGCLLWPVCSLGKNSVKFCPASFCTPRQNLPVTPGIFWLPTSTFQPLIMKEYLFWVLVLEGLVGLHRTVQLKLLQLYWMGHSLGLLWYWMICLGNEQRSFCCFWDCIQVPRAPGYNGTARSSREELPHVQGQGGGRGELPHSEGQGLRPRGATPHWRSAVVAERSNPTPEVREGGRGELSHTGGQWQRPRGATPHPRSGSREELPHVQRQEQRLHFAGSAVKRYPTFKVRETQVRW